MPASYSMLYEAPVSYSMEYKAPASYIVESEARTGAGLVQIQVRVQGAGVRGRWRGDDG